MRYPIFLSYPKPFSKEQEKFISKLEEYLKNRGWEPRTLGVTDYDLQNPLSAIRSLMMESNGIIVIALKRYFIKEGYRKQENNVDDNLPEGTWMTSPYCQIEPAMAYQLGLPILILREEGVLAEGILEKGVTGLYLPEIKISNDIPLHYLDSEEWTQIIGKWEGYVRRVIENKGTPPNLY